MDEVMKAAADMRERAAQEVDCGCAWRDSVLRWMNDPLAGQRQAERLCQYGCMCWAIQAATIRNLPLVAGGEA
jgi:hypothetical protein